MKLTGNHRPRVRRRVDSEISRRLIEVRRDFGLDEKDFASRVGLSEGALASYERGARIPKVATIAIGAVFGVNAEWLCSGHGEKYLPPSRMKMLSADLELLQLIKRHSIYDLVSSCVGTRPKPTGSRDGIERAGRIARRWAGASAGPRSRVIAHDRPSSG